MQKLTNEELARAHDAQDWGLLWLAAQPLVKLTIRRMIQKGELLSARWSDVDLRQEGVLAAGAAVRSWNTLESAFSSWVSIKVRGALLDYVRREARGGLGGEGDVPFLVSAHEEPRKPGAEEEEEEGDTYLDLLTYPEDEVLPRPDIEAERINALRLLKRLGPSDRDVVQRLFGIQQDPQSLAEIAFEKGISRKQARTILDRVWRLMTPGPQ